MRKKLMPVAFVAVSGNPDFEGTSALYEYIELINTERVRVFNAPPLFLYWSLLGPRIPDRYHAYDPITEALHICTIDGSSSGTHRTDHDTGISNVPLHDPHRSLSPSTSIPIIQQYHTYALLIHPTMANNHDGQVDHHLSPLHSRFRESIARDLERAVKKSPLGGRQFATDAAPRLMYVREEKLKRIPPPSFSGNAISWLTAEEEEILIARVASINTIGHSIAIDTTYRSETHDQLSKSNLDIGNDPLARGQMNEDLYTQLHDPANAWTRAFSHSGVLSLRYARMLNQVRKEVGFPALGVYWTASTRNKNLCNGRRGLVLVDITTTPSSGVRVKVWYTGDTGMVQTQDEEAKDTDEDPNHRSTLPHRPGCIEHDAATKPRRTNAGPTRLDSVASHVDDIWLDKVDENGQPHHAPLADQVTHQEAAQERRQRPGRGRSVFEERVNTYIRASEPQRRLLRAQLKAELLSRTALSSPCHPHSRSPSQTLTRSSEGHTRSSNEFTTATAHSHPMSGTTADDDVFATEGSRQEGGGVGGVGGTDHNPVLLRIAYSKDTDDVSKWVIVAAGVPLGAKVENFP